MPDKTTTDLHVFQYIKYLVYTVHNTTDLYILSGRAGVPEIYFKDPLTGTPSTTLTKYFKLGNLKLTMSSFIRSLALTSMRNRN